jgi:hypothetical protein
MTKQKNTIFIIAVILLIVITLGSITILFIISNKKEEEQVTSQTQIDQKETKTINGLIYLIVTHADEEIDGLLQWEQELNNRNITALIKASKPVLEKYPEVFKRLSNEGHEIMVGNPDSCWDMPYQEQYDVMKESMEYVENLTGNPLKVYACKYSSYDENTVKAAEELGIEYVLARGTEDIRAVIYQPEEYDVKLLEVSNVEFGDMGKGSLCDISLYARGSTEEDFADVVEESFRRNPDSMILVSHPHIGGTKKAYWEVYEDALNSEKATWRTFEEFMQEITVIEKIYTEIPVNTEVQYLEPNPAVPLDELEDLPEVGTKMVIFHNGSGPMCLDMMDFLETIDYPIEEHLNTESGFNELLESYKLTYKTSTGESEEFGFYPIIFIEDKAYSGFNDDIKEEILNIVQN